MITFDPAWEYYTPDPEIHEILLETSTLHGFEGLINPRIEYNDLTGKSRYGNSGIRFGKGNPNYYKTRLGPERQTIERQTLTERECKNPKCKEWYMPVYNGQKYCRLSCRILPGRVKVLPRELNCLKCDRAFIPRYSTHYYCSRRCVAGMGGHRPKVEELEIFKRMYEEGKSIPQIARVLGLSVAWTKKLRKRAGCPPRSLGWKPKGFVPANKKEKFRLTPIPHSV